MIKFKNNAVSVLTGSLTTLSTDILINAADDGLFPVIAAIGADYFYLTLEDEDHNIEVVKIVRHVSGSNNLETDGTADSGVNRGLDGSTARAWDIGDVVEIRPTALTLTEVIAEAQATQAAVAIQDFRLIKSGADLTLQRITGNAININGVVQVLSGSLPTLSAASMTPDTTYYIYAYWTGSAVSLEASTTGYTVGTTGRAEKTADTSRRLVGMARCLTGPIWADNEIQRLTVSYNHRRRIVAAVSHATTFGTSTNGVVYDVFAQTGVAKPEFLLWADDNTINAETWGHIFGVSGKWTTSIGVDGTTAIHNQWIQDANTSPRQPFAVPATKTGLAEGYHDARLLALLNNASSFVYWGGGALEGFGMKVEFIG